MMIFKQNMRKKGEYPLFFNSFVFVWISTESKE